jgi:hypothetical protein
MAVPLLIDQWAAFAGPTVFGPDATPAQKALDAFRCRVSMAMVKAAMEISNEGAAAPFHPQRIALAQKVLSIPPSWMPAFAQAVAAQGLDNKASDQAIRDEVAAVWNAIAGAVA